MGGRRDEENVIKVMVVGDSISHGREGDWTWRYRIWEWFQQQGISARFVGPYRGTRPPDKPHPPRPPPLPEEPPELPPPVRTDGGYAIGVDREFLSDSCHFAVSGQQAYQAKDLIAEQVSIYQPDLCLVQLGFNDLGWRLCGPLQTLASMKHLVDEARSAKTDLKFAIADIPQRTALPGREDLPVATDLYNRMLAQSIPRWSTHESPVAIVGFCANYSCGGTISDAAYDGLHPNSLGEYQLAQAFSQTLVSVFSLGHSPLAIPENVPPRPLLTPARLAAVSTQSGIIVTWDAVYGAFGYDIQHRHVGQRDWSITHVECNTYYWPPLSKNQAVECRVRSCGGNELKSEWSDVSRAVAEPETAPPPVNIVTHATPAGFTISWDDPPPPYSGKIDRFGIAYFDSDQPGAFLTVVGAKGNRAEMTGLIPGHRHFISIETWTTVGRGVPCGASAVVVGKGTPPTPTQLRARALDFNTVELSWPRVDGAAGYGISVREKDSHAITPHAPLPRPSLLKSTIQDTTWKPEIVTATLWVTPSVWAFQYAIWAYNGDDLSGRSEWVTLPLLDIEEVSVAKGDSIHVHLHVENG
ncbi:hypothetical protein VTI28DRAFT_42 [Corynascus sepedonium]